MGRNCVAIVAKTDILLAADKAVDGTVATGPKETARGSADKRPESAKLFVVPKIPTRAELAEAIKRMTPLEAQQALRHRVVPISWEPGRTTFVAAGERAKAYANGEELEVTAITNERTMLGELQAGQESELLNYAASGLRSRHPRHSSAEPLGAKQALWLVLTLALIAFGAMWDRPTASVVAFTMMLALFALAAGLKLWCLLPTKLPRAPVALIIADAELPVYSIFVPLLHDSRIAEQSWRAIQALDYPHAKLDIKFILAADDEATRKFFEEQRLPSHIEVITVPKGAPDTKHRALNFALPFARGELVAVYDADSVPAPDQLRRIAGSFALAPKTVACLQTQVGFFNRQENWLARQCALEQAHQFKLLFPRLAKLGAPLLFAGSSAHYRIAILRQLGGFDAHNVGRDSGLGLRLARFGFRTALVPTLTREEAPLRLADWFVQRIRWTRGTLQTAAVNLRSPVKLARELGGGKMFLIEALSLGALIAALAHPLFLAWLGATGALLVMGEPSAPQLWLFLLALYGIVAALAFLATMASAARSSLFLGGGLSWGMTVMTVPVYWLMISLASWLAVLQYFTGFKGSTRTRHGMTRVRPQIGPKEAKPQKEKKLLPAAGLKPQSGFERKPQVIPVKKPPLVGKEKSPAAGEQKPLAGSEKKSLEDVIKVLGKSEPK